MFRETTAMACERQRIDFLVTVLSAARVRLSLLDRSGRRDQSGKLVAGHRSLQGAIASS